MWEIFYCQRRWESSNRRKASLTVKFNRKPKNQQGK